MDAQHQRAGALARLQLHVAGANLRAGDRHNIASQGVDHARGPHCSQPIDDNHLVKRDHRSSHRAGTRTGLLRLHRNSHEQAKDK
jgi:hypothetical protein